MEYKIGEKYRLYSAWDKERTGKYDVFEVVRNAGELIFFNHTDKSVFEIDFIGARDLVKEEKKTAYGNK